MRMLNQMAICFFTALIFSAAVNCLYGEQKQNPNAEVGEITDAVLNAMVANRTWQGIPGLERTSKGRLFFTWFTGGEKEPRPENIAILCYSDDDGKTHSPLQVLGPHFSDGTRAFDPVPWIDPKGRLWYFFQRNNNNTGEYGLYARICEYPDAPVPMFGPEFQIDLGTPFVFGINKPIVLSTGEWAKPVNFKRKKTDQWVEGVGISHDEGKTWKLHGAVAAPPRTIENMIVELKDGRLWMLMRTGAGYLWESFSADKGVTWSEGKRSQIESPGSRFFIRRLSSGNLLLVNHYKFDRKDDGSGIRSHLTAQISIDDGKTWNEGLLLDSRQKVSYPDGVEDKDGVIRIIYDHSRTGNGDILMAKFREEDVAQGKNVSGTVLLQHVIDRLKK